MNFFLFTKNPIQIKNKKKKDFFFGVVGRWGVGLE